MTIEPVEHPIYGPATVVLSDGHTKHETGWDQKAGVGLEKAADKHNTSAKLVNSPLWSYRL